MSVFHPIVDFCYRDPNLFAPFWYIVFPAILWPSFGRLPTDWITSALLWGAVGAIQLTCDHHFIFLVCCLFCWWHVYSLSIFFIPDLTHSGLSCSFSETPHLCTVNICLSGECPSFILVKRVGVSITFMICVLY